MSDDDPLPAVPEDDPVPDVPVDDPVPVPVEEDDPPAAEVPVLEVPCVPDVEGVWLPDDEEPEVVPVVEGTV